MWMCLPILWYISILKSFENINNLQVSVTKSREIMFLQMGLNIIDVKFFFFCRILERKLSYFMKKICNCNSYRFKKKEWILENVALQVSTNVLKILNTNTFSKVLEKNAIALVFKGLQMTTHINRNIVHSDIGLGNQYFNIL